MNRRTNPGADINTIVHTPVAHAEATGDAALNRPLQMDLRMAGNRISSSLGNSSGLPSSGDGLFLFALSDGQIAWWRRNTIQIDSLTYINRIRIPDMVATGEDMVIKTVMSANAIQGIPLANEIDPGKGMGSGTVGSRGMAGQAGCVAPAQAQKQEDQK